MILRNCQIVHLPKDIWSWTYPQILAVLLDTIFVHFFFNFPISTFSLPDNFKCSDDQSFTQKVVLDL